MVARFLFTLAVRSTTQYIISTSFSARIARKVVTLASLRSRFLCAKSQPPDFIADMVNWTRDSSSLKRKLTGGHASLPKTRETELGAGRISRHVCSGFHFFGQRSWKIQIAGALQGRNAHAVFLSRVARTDTCLYDQADDRNRTKHYGTCCGMRNSADRSRSGRAKRRESRAPCLAPATRAVELLSQWACLTASVLSKSINPKVKRDHARRRVRRLCVTRDAPRFESGNRVFLQWFYFYVRASGKQKRDRHVHNSKSSFSSPKKKKSRKKNVRACTPSLNYP